MLSRRINGGSTFRSLLIAIIASGALFNSALGAQTGDSTSIIFYGKLVKTTVCKLNNDKPIVVDLGNVGIMKVSSGNYIKDIDYTLECTNVSATSIVDITLLGTVQSWDAKALSSDVNGLGARILFNGNALEMQKPVDIGVGTTPKLQVQLVSQPGVTLQEKPFSVTGTLLISYK